MFEPIDILPIVPSKHGKHYRSVTRLPNEAGEKVHLKFTLGQQQQEGGSNKNIKIILKKNAQEIKREKEREEEAEPVFRNTCLKGLPRDEKKVNEFIIKKTKVQHAEDKNSINLFHSVLSSLRKDRK